MPKSPASSTRARPARGPEPVYVLLGDDRRAADEFIRELKKKLVAPGFEPFDLEEFHAEDIPVQQALQHMRQPPVGSARRLVVVRSADALGRPAFAELARGLAQLPAGSCTVVVTCAWSRSVADALAAAGLGRFVVSLKPPEGRELAARVKTWAAGLGLDMTADAVSLLLELSGSDTTLLWSELEKLATAVEPGTRIDTATVRRLAGRSRDFALKDYIDHRARGDLAQALEVLARLEAWGEQPHQILGWLVTSLLRRAEDLTHGHEQERQAELIHIRRMMHQLYNINRALLTGHPEPFALLSMFTVCSCCLERGPACRLSGQTRNPGFCLRRQHWRAGKSRQGRWQKAE